MSVRRRRLAAALLCLLFAAAAFRVWSRHAVVFDDAYISYRYADNLVAGQGLVYNPGDRVQGYTNFSWTLLAAAAIGAGRDPLAATRALGVAAQLAAVGALAGVAAWLWLAPGLAGLALLPALAALLLPEGFAAQAGTGLESSFVGFLLVAAGIVLLAGDPTRRSMRALLATLLLLASLTRLDTLTATAAAALAIAGSACATGVSLRDALLRALSVAVPVAIGVATYLVFCTAYYGDALPNTYYAKAADVPHWREGFAYLGGFLRSEPQSVALLLLAALPLALRADERRFRLALFAVPALLAELVYMARVGGDFMEYRLLWQVYGLLVLGAIAGLSLLLERSRPAAIAAAAVCFALCFQPAVLEKRYGMQSLAEMDGYTRTGELVGRRLAEVLPPDTVLATTLAGTIAYFSKKTVIDQWGLNDRSVAHQPYRRVTFARGHVKSAPQEHLRSRGVNLRIDHPVVCACSQLCRNGRPTVFVTLGEDRCLRTWYIGPKPELTEYFCAHPEWFVLDGIHCDEPGASP
jgi:arabinofuranosyltransferase